MNTSCSFRAIEEVISITNTHLHLNLKVPSFVTILLWTKKIGCYRLETGIEKADDWILILDESIQFGHEKLLVIYGVRASKIDFTRALNYTDLTPFLICAKSSWTGDLIRDEIDIIIEKIGGIIYGY